MREGPNHVLGRGGETTTQGQEPMASEKEERQDEHLVELGLQGLQLHSQPVMTAATKMSNSGCDLQGVWRVPGARLLACLLSAP